MNISIELRIATALLWGCSFSGMSEVSASQTPLQLMQIIESRAEPSRVRAEIHFVVTDPKGRRQDRQAIAYRISESTITRQAVYLIHPRPVAGTALLTWRDGKGVRPDDQWLYLPALKRSRRVPITDQSRPFLGTDLSLGDMRTLAKVNTNEFRFTDAVEVENAQGHWLVSGEPVDAQTAQSLGYGASRWLIDIERQIVLESEHRSTAGQPFKRVRYDDVVLIDDVWTPQLVEVHNLQSGSRTELRFQHIDTQATFEASLLTETGLARGP